MADDGGGKPHPRSDLPAGLGSATEPVRYLLFFITAASVAVFSQFELRLRNEAPQHRPIDINEVVQEVLALMRSDLVTRQVRVRTELAPELPAVSGNRIQLQQVLLNLLINAADAIASFDAPRDLVVRSALASARNVAVSVADRGLGIPPENLARIFEPFVTTKAQGMGLGLAVCRSIVKAHGVRLWASNNPDGGATLRIELPAHGALPDAP